MTSEFLKRIEVKYHYNRIFNLVCSRIATAKQYKQTNGTYKPEIVLYKKKEEGALTSDVYSVLCCSQQELQQDL